MDMDDIYREIILDHYKHPRNYGWIETAPAGQEVMQIKASNASCGDSFEVSLLLCDGKVVEVKWRGEGCALSTASMSLTSEWMLGKTLIEIKQLHEVDILGLLGMASITTAREHCLYLPMRLLGEL